jgi:hypothetical protein
MKTWKMRLGIGLAVSALFAVLACGSSSSGAPPGSFTCMNGGNCVYDMPPSQTSMDQCMAFLMDPKCGPKYSEYGTCLLGTTKCDANGKTHMDPSKCTTQLTVFQNCLAAELTDAGGTDAGTSG